jgi:HlyD family secretion protein
VAVATEKAAGFEISASESIVKQYSEALVKTTVYAPMEGVVTSLITQLGEKVVGTSQFAGTEMMTISDLTWMNAEVDVDENDVVNLKIGDTAMVTIDAFPNRVFVGQVIEVANSAKLKGNGTQDQSTNFKVKVKLSDFAGADLRPGMSCTAKIHTQTKTNVMAIPINAVTRRDDPDAAKVDSAKRNSIATTTESPVVVFVVGKDSRVKLTTIKTGIADNTYVEVLSGLIGDEEIVKGEYSAVSKDLQDKKLIKVDNSTTKTTTTTQKN